MALALFTFPSLAAYETYEENHMKRKSIRMISLGFF